LLAGKSAHLVVLGVHSSSDARLLTLVSRVRLVAALLIDHVLLELGVVLVVLAKQYLLLACLGRLAIVGVLNVLRVLVYVVGW
jgi:hypothetical protein